MKMKYAPLFLALFIINTTEAASSCDTWLQAKTPKARTMLLRHHCDLNAKDNLGWTALQHAVRDGDIDFASWLLDNGATLGDACSQAKTAEMRELLLKHGWDINAKDGDGWTALKQALRLDNDLDFVSWLLDHGATFEASGDPDFCGDVYPINVASYKALPVKQGAIEAEEELYIRKKLGEYLSLKAIDCQTFASNYSEANFEVGLNLLQDYYNYKKQPIPEYITASYAFLAALRANDGHKMFEILHSHHACLFPVSVVKGHAVTAGICGDCFIVANRGAEDTKRFNPSGIRVYKILDRAKLDRRLLRLFSVKDLHNSSKESMSTWKQILSLKSNPCLVPYYDIVMKGQTIGNCSWMSTATAIEAMLVATSTDGLAFEDPQFEEKANDSLAEYREFFLYWAVKTFAEYVQCPYVQRLLERALTASEAQKYALALTQALQAGNIQQGYETLQAITKAAETPVAGWDETATKRVAGRVIATILAAGHTLQQSWESPSPYADYSQRILLHWLATHQ